MEPNNSNPQSFKPYTGKAPGIVQLVGGLLWLGAAGTIIIGLFSILLNIIQGIILLVAAVCMIITARSLFKMKKEAFRNCMILGGILLILCIYLIATSKGAPNYSNLISPLIILIVGFVYKNQFVN